MERQVELGVESNVRQSMKQIADHPDHRDAVRAGDVVVAGAVYQMATGRVRFLED